ncbi:isochorismate synthase MenF [Halobacillus andaensis]|uniref:Isochorismate synthase MenF n=1 Tax=Halobacillus andaensis TaxID=1176239 RepID=A0A917F1B3_HALAA|nr:isochorismate synthase [Halobacillus andaensis]MBP2005616.1 menaquinone-specific isochorismate synthase [Halobacillus andaensis]GGF32904.1 isochorismate synthase MenF [Halobacillus andaensis]
MLHTKIPQIEEIVEEAINQASLSGEPQFISIVNQIDYTDSIAFLDRASQIDQHRLFWRSADEEFTLVGVGSTKKILSSNAHRFNEIEAVWNEIQQKANVYDILHEKGTGLVSIGGFSFDTEQENGKPWEGFPDSQMTIPMYLLTNKSDQSFLTTNILILKEDHKQQIVHQIRRDHEQLLFGERQELKLPTCIGRSDVEPDEWKAIVEQATSDIKDKELEKVVLAREVRITFSEDVELAAVIERLCETQMNSYIFTFESGGDYFVGATPERLAKVDNQELVSTCLAGTIPRGQDVDEDRELGEQLLNDPKNRQEHEFVVQMIREAVEACCYNVTIPEEPIVYPLRNLQHLYTPVTATLEKGYTLLDVVARLHPTPALGGLPQQTSVDYIRKREVLNRGWYAGPIGWFDGKNNGEFAVAIRSALLQKKAASLFAGCGVVEDSDPDAEFAETGVKLKPMLSALGGY